MRSTSKNLRAFGLGERREPRGRSKNGLAAGVAIAAFSWASAFASPYTYGEKEGLLTYDATNLGLPGNTPVEDRSVPVVFDSDSGSASFFEQFNAEISAGRITQGSVVAEASVQFSDEFFFGGVTVGAAATCLVNPTEGTCPPSASSQGDLSFTFSPSEDGIFYYDIDWKGSDGGGLSIVDFFSFEIRRRTGNPFNPQELVDINTNRNGVTEDRGRESGSFTILAGMVYEVVLSNKTVATDAEQFDNGFVYFAGGTTVVNALALNGVGDPVPVPGAALLFAPAILAGLAFRRRKATLADVD